jgi:hypothetical protein
VGWHGWSSLWIKRQSGVGGRASDSELILGKV